jgi:hypothetical protein
MEVPQSPSEELAVAMEIELNSDERLALEKIAQEQGKTVDQVATEAVAHGLKNFFGFEVPIRDSN